DPVRNFIGAPQIIDELQHEALVHLHRRMAEAKLVAGIGSKLHGVHEQTRTGRKTWAGKASGAWIILLHGAHDGLIVGTGRFGDHIALTAGCEFDVAISVIKELVELRFDRLHYDEFGRNSTEDLARFFFGIPGRGADDLRHLV